MKHLPLSLLALLAFPISALSFGGSGPWADGAYYPGGLNGKYVGIVTGNNIAGVLGFGIVDGAPPFRQNQNQTSSGGNSPIAIVNPTFEPDQLQNYYGIFVEGRTYTGLTYAGVDIDKKSIAGALIGAAPAFTAANVNNPDTGAGGGGIVGPPAYAVVDALPVVNRGLSGGFTAKVKSNRNVFTFKGNGQLSTPANLQVVNVTSIPAVYNPVDDPPSPAGTITNQVSTGFVTTESTPFTISGIRTSLFSTSPQSRQDEREFSQGSAGANGGN